MPKIITYPLLRGRKKERKGPDPYYFRPDPVSRGMLDLTPSFSSLKVGVPLFVKGTAEKRNDGTKENN
jgi:hypothetical protein